LQKIQKWINIVLNPNMDYFLIMNNPKMDFNPKSV
jgi:hypothetical protein